MREEIFVGALVPAIGALFFVAVYISLSSQNLSPAITTPQVSAADTKPILFECRGNTVFRPGYDELLDRTQAVFGRCVGANNSRVNACVTALTAEPEKNEFYRTKPLLIHCPPDGKLSLAVGMEQVSGSKGESMVELRSPSSAFQRELSRLDPSVNHLIFYVRGDSFAVFHSARQVAKKMGFRSGWEPIDVKVELGTGCAGGPRGGFRLDPQ